MRFASEHAYLDFHGVTSKFLLAAVVRGRSDAAQGAGDTIVATIDLWGRDRCVDALNAELEFTGDVVVRQCSLWASCNIRQIFEWEGGAERALALDMRLTGCGGRWIDIHRVRLLIVSLKCVSLLSYKLMMVGLFF